MAGEKPTRFWRRLKDKLVGMAHPATRQALPDKGRDGANSVLSTSELKTDTVGRVYAQALLELAREQGTVDELADEVQQLMAVIAEDGELNRLLTNPAIGDVERAKIVERIFGGKVSESSFISHDRSDLHNSRVAELKSAGADILCWTVKSPEQEAEARKVAQNITFEQYLAPFPG